MQWLFGTGPRAGLCASATLLSIVATCGLTRTTVAQCELVKLSGEGTLVTDHFGNAVAVDGERALVGVSLDDDAVEEAGSVRVFERVAGAWVEQQKWISEEPGIAFHFGEAATLQGNLAFVGEPFYRPDGLATVYGQVHVFKFGSNGWAKLQQLRGTDDSAFGSEIAVEGERVLVGSPDNGAYVFRRTPSGWPLEERLSSADPTLEVTQFGRRVALTGRSAST